GVPRRFPAEDQDRARRRRLDRGAGHRSDHERGAHREDRRRQGVRDRAGAGGAPPHRRTGGRGSLSGLKGTGRTTVRKILATSRAFMGSQGTRLALALLGLAALGLLIGMATPAAWADAAAEPEG